MLGVVVLASLPEPVKHDGELSCHSHDSSLLGIPSSAASQLEPPAAEIAVGPKGSKDVLGTAHQEATKIGVVMTPESWTEDSCGLDLLQS